MIVRRERPHPGAQLSFTDHDGYRFQAILTDQADQADQEIAIIECRHRQRARVEDRIRDDKDTGLAKFRPAGAPNPADPSGPPAPRAPSRKRRIHSQLRARPLTPPASLHPNRLLTSPVTPRDGSRVTFARLLHEPG